MNQPPVIRAVLSGVAYATFESIRGDGGWVGAEARGRIQELDTRNGGEDAGACVRLVDDRAGLRRGEVGEGSGARVGGNET